MSSANQAPKVAPQHESSSRSTRHRIGFGQAVALYVGAVLGAGVLVLPGQAASMAGPASLLSWLFMGLLGLPLAMTFAALATRYPDAGGIATYATRAFGPTAGGLAGWFYFTAGSIGQTIVPLTGGYYVATALRIHQSYAFLIAAVILALAVGANLVGLRLSGRVQLGLAGGVALLLLAATLAAVPHVRADAFTSFAPHGLSGVAQAAVILFFAFAGWEAVAHLAGEFRDVRRDLTRATLTTVVVVIVLYLGVSFAVVGTGTYGNSKLDRIAVGQVLGTGLGFSATVAAAVLATVISLGTTNAFIASVSRLGYALGRDGWLPRPLSRLNTREVPANGVFLVGGIGAAGLLVSYLGNWGTEDIVGIPSSLVLVTYLIGTAAGARLLTGRARSHAVIALVLTLLVAPFAAAYAIVPVIVAAVALVYRWARDRISNVRKPV
ncbi:MULTISPECIES: amino acid permease [unclassified Streptomyces]|uniref:APC family permease n=1 Tax=unclassified Streptomyces TaxID=2593676 RepID=UPI002E0DDE28|nr:amino acid permease [Streptomyces sp. NBC_01197]WSS51522.1 amino acid permease [Streptomyces sp. NBC_01180]